MNKYKIMYNEQELARPTNPDVIYKRDQSMVIEAEDINQASDKFYQLMGTTPKGIDVFAIF